VQLLTEAAAAQGVLKTFISEEDAKYTASVVQDMHVGYVEVGAFEMAV
jgi:hypothetical protein